MPLRNTEDSYGSLAKFLHWSIVLLVLLQWLLVEAAEDAGEGTAERSRLMGLHLSFGMLVFGLAITRIVWKIRSRGLPTPLGDAPQRAMAASGHGLLYLLILLLPLTGWLVVSTAGRDVGFFGLFAFPALMGENHDLHETLESVHEFLFNALVVLSVLHVAAALYHHLILKDATLKRMLPFRRG